MNTGATSDPGFDALTAKIARDRGFACGSYKPTCLRRRIAVRMRARGVHRYADYAALLDRDRDEYEKLIDTLTINVTRLYRNPEAWLAVERQVWPALFTRKERELRAWSAGCSSGEEPYTLAISALRAAEAAGTPAAASRVRITATDIDLRSLEAARAGAFAEPAFADVPAGVRERWFEPGWPARARDAARALVRVERRDLLEEAPPPGPWHLIVCRNVIIYFDRESQEALFHRFRDALAPGGFLVLGKVETLLGDSRALFEPVNSRERIFRRPPAAAA
ncbi:MAG: protein-glutamate O-methyltransferase CheR [Gemmatimonadetes bacterium]|nr:protein-glutamate O-methyltransferase CheR [Gemmatimonadota bacterium]